MADSSSFVLLNPFTQPTQASKNSECEPFVEPEPGKIGVKAEATDPFGLVALFKQGWVIHEKEVVVRGACVRYQAARESAKLNVKIRKIRDCGIFSSDR